MNILDNLFYGDKPPVENPQLNNNPTYHNLQSHYNQIQEFLLSTLTGESLKIFKQLESLNLHIQSIIEKDCWTAGFKMGVQVMVESLNKSKK